MDKVSNIILNKITQYDKLSLKFLQAQVIFYTKKYLIKHYDINIVQSIKITFYNNIIKFKTKNSTISTDIKMHETSLINYLKKNIPNINIKGITF